MKESTKKLTITVSFTGFDRKQYNKFMGVDKFDIVKKHIIELRKQEISISDIVKSVSTNFKTRLGNTTISKWINMEEAKIPTDGSLNSKTQYNLQIN